MGSAFGYCDTCCRLAGVAFRCTSVCFPRFEPVAVGAHSCSMVLQHTLAMTPTQPKQAGRRRWLHLIFISASCAATSTCMPQACTHDKGGPALVRDSSYSYAHHRHKHKHKRHTTQHNPTAQSQHGRSRHTRQHRSTKCISGGQLPRSPAPSLKVLERRRLTCGVS